MADGRSTRQSRHEADSRVLGCSKRATDWYANGRQTRTIRYNRAVLIALLLI